MTHSIIGQNISVYQYVELKERRKRKQEASIKFKRLKSLSSEEIINRKYTKIR